MKQLVWDESFEIGVQEIDTQHKELIKLLAAEAVDQFLEEQQLAEEEKPMETGERHATHSDY